MSSFLTPLKVEQLYYDEKLWQLTAPLYYWSDYLQRFVVAPEGFITDFCSVPRLPLIFAIDGDIGQKGGVIHDLLYADPTVSRADADAVLREALGVCGANGFQRWSMWAAVRCFGWRYKTNVTNANVREKK